MDHQSNSSRYGATPLLLCLSLVIPMSCLSQVPIIDAFEVTPAVVAPGAKVSLTWSVTSSAALSIDQGIGDVADQSAVIDEPATSRTYTLTASNEFGGSTATVKVIVGKRPQIVSFISSAGVVAPYGNVDLEWIASGASSITLEPGGIDVSGKSLQTVTPVGPTSVFRLVASNAFGTVSAQLKIFTGDPKITEFMASNSGDLADENGDQSDWIEIYNPFSFTFDASGYYLTDNSVFLTKWRIPDGVILEPNDLLVVFASGKDRSVIGSELHTNFRLDANGEYLALVAPNGNRVVSEYAPQFPEQFEDVSFGVEETLTPSPMIDQGTNANLLLPTSAGELPFDWNQPGFNPNTSWIKLIIGVGLDNGFPIMAPEEIPSSAFLLIPFNVSEPGTFDRLILKMKYDDGFVAYLNRVEVVRRNAPTIPKWNSVATASRSNADALLFERIDISWAMGELVLGQNILAIHAMNMAVADDYFIPVTEIEAVTVASRSAYFSSSTPGNENEVGFSGLVGDTAFDPDRGFYTAATNITISTPTLGAQIFFTTDGSEPTPSNGAVYAEPIPITTTTTLRAAAFLADYIPANVDTHTYIFAADVVKQPNDPASFPTDWGTHIMYNWKTQVMESFLAAADYGMDTSVATAHQLKKAIEFLPAISLVMDRDDLFDSTAGIYSNPMPKVLAEKRESWERPASVELIHLDGTRGFQENAGIRMQGAASRRPWTTPKHSFRILFKDEYGVGKLEYPLFIGSHVDRFNTLVLRAGFNDAWTICDERSASDNALYISDQWARDSHRDMGQLAASGRFVNLFLNGLYWGVYNLHERPDASFQSEHQGGADADWDVICHKDPYVVDGTIDTWNNLYSDTITNPLDYGKVLDNLNVVSLIDYMLLNLYNGTHDWMPNNWYAARRIGLMQGYQFFIWDAEMSFNSDNFTGIDIANSPARLYSELRDSPDFRMLFADRAHFALANGGALTKAASKARLQRLADEISNAIRGESARWGDVSRTPPYTFENDWLPELSQMMMFLEDRDVVLLDQLRDANLFPSADPPAFAQHGGQVPFNFELTINTDRGVAYYTLDGSDPRLSSGAISPTALLYNPALKPQLTATGPVCARTLDTSEWSALTKASFIVGIPAAAANLVISKFDYNPAAANALEDPSNIYNRKDFEFLELVNISLKPVELANVKFVSGIEFDFNTSSILTIDPGQYIVVVSNPDAFAARYPSVPASYVAGVFRGNLSNDGEQIVLEAANGSAICDFTFNDQPPWPHPADGDGFFLVLNDPFANPNHGDPRNWHPSKASVDLNWEQPPAIVYGNRLSAKELRAIATVAGTFSYEPPVGTLLSAGTHLLNVTFNPDSPSYDAKQAQSKIIVKKAELSVSVADTFRAISTSNPEFEISYDGFNNKEDKSDLLAVAKAVTTAEIDSPSGDYPITLSGVISNNYAINYQIGNLTVVDKLRLVVEVPNTGKVTWSPQKDLYDLGEEVTLEAIPSTGHAFVGWEGDYKGTDNPFTIKMDIKMDKNITLKPKFAKLFRFVGVVEEGKGEVVISPKQEWYSKRTPVEVEAIPADGYEFVKWTLRGYDFHKSKDNPLKGFKTYDADMEIAAHFKHTKLERAKEPIIKDLTASPFSFRFDTEPNRNYSIEGSSDLKAWEVLEQFKSTKRSHQFSNPRNTVFEHQYYRVKVTE